MKTIRELLSGRPPCSALEQELIAACDDRDNHITALEAERVDLRYLVSELIGTKDWVLANELLKQEQES
jgi:hypothetical protein